MMDKNHYLQILVDSLEKKKAILDSIIELNRKQSEIVSEETFRSDAFDETVDEKGKLIEKLNLLDDGFESVYDRVKEDLLSNREKYKEEIRQLQRLISEVTERSVTIQTEEERNRKLVLSKLSVEKKKVHQAKVNSQAANNYYNNMRRINTIDAQFLDSKK